MLLRALIMRRDRTWVSLVILEKLNQVPKYSQQQPLGTVGWVACSLPFLYAETECALARKESVVGLAFSRAGL